MTDNWVGFARSPKGSQTAILESFEFEIHSGLDLGASIQLISTAPGVASWLADLTTPPRKWKFVPGAKLLFADELGEYGATFGAVNLPTEVVLVTERYGEIQLGFHEFSAAKKFGFAKFWGKRENAVTESTPGAQASGTKIRIKLSRLCEPAELAVWEQAVEALISRFGVAAQQRSNSVGYSNE